MTAHNSTPSKELVLMTLKAAGRAMTAVELGSHGVSRMALKRLTESGVLERVARGIYKATETSLDDPRAIWAAVSLRMPQAVFCLESAAAYHGITQNMASQLNIALPQGSRKPTDELTAGISARFMSWRPSSFEAGIEQVIIDGVEVNVTSPARTVVDMYRYSTISPERLAPNKLIDPETFHDCLTRYFEKEGLAAGVSGLRKIAKTMAIWNYMKPHIDMIKLSFEKGLPEIS